jgi:hypothetical protein
MHIEIGVVGLGILLVISAVFGVIAQVLFSRATRWLWLIGGAAWFVGGLVASEVVWSTSTADDLQPIIDGLAFDESLLGGLVLGVPVVLVTWLVARRGRTHGPLPS